MAIVVSILIIVISIVLVLVVLVQNSKGGGLAANFSSSNQIMGVRKTTDFIEKLTWGLAISLLVLCLASSALIPRNAGNLNESIIQEEVDNAPETMEVPEFNSEEFDLNQTEEAPAEEAAPKEDK